MPDCEGCESAPTSVVLVRGWWKGMLMRRVVIRGLRGWERWGGWANTVCAGHEERGYEGFGVPLLPTDMTGHIAVYEPSIGRVLGGNGVGIW